jgi:hypothetical protein
LFICSTANRRREPAGSSPTELSSLKPMQEMGPWNDGCTWALFSYSGSSAPGLRFQKPIWESRTQNSHSLLAWFSMWAAVPQNCTRWCPYRKSGPGTPVTCRLWSPKPAAAAVASGSPIPNKSRPLGLLSDAITGEHYHARLHAF